MRPLSLHALATGLFLGLSLSLARAGDDFRDHRDVQLRVLEERRYSEDGNTLLPTTDGDRLAALAFFTKHLKPPGGSTGYDDPVQKAAEKILAGSPPLPVAQAALDLLGVLAEHPTYADRTRNLLYLSIDPAQPAEVREYTRQLLSRMETEATRVDLSPGYSPGKEHRINAQNNLVDGYAWATHDEKVPGLAEAALDRLAAMPRLYPTVESELIGSLFSLRDQARTWIRPELETRLEVVLQRHTHAPATLLKTIRAWNVSPLARRSPALRTFVKNFDPLSIKDSPLQELPEYLDDAVHDLLNSRSTDFLRKDVSLQRHLRLAAYPVDNDLRLVSDVYQQALNPRNLVHGTPAERELYWAAARRIQEAAAADRLPPEYPELVLRSVHSAGPQLEKALYAMADPVKDSVRYRSLADDVRRAKILARTLLLLNPKTVEVNHHSPEMAWAFSGTPGPSDICHIRALREVTSHVNAESN